MRVKDLFVGHRELTLGFNTFLLLGYEILLPPERENLQAPVESDQAFGYVSKIKARFKVDDQVHVYKGFLKILIMFREGKRTMVEVY